MDGNGCGTAVELDSTTSQAVEHLARAWGVSQQEALRRAVQQAETTVRPVSGPDRLTAFKALQRRLQVTPARASEWQAAAGAARR
jgi:hypothetical protein